MQHRCLGECQLLGKWCARGSYHQVLGGAPALLGAAGACCRSALVYAELSRSLRQHLQTFDWVSLRISFRCAC